MPLVWEVYSAEEKEEFYYIYLTYQPLGEFPGTPGREEFIVDKTGEIEFRQVLEEPNPEGTRQEASQPPSPRVRFTTSPR